MSLCFAGLDIGLTMEDVLYDLSVTPGVVAAAKLDPLDVLWLERVSSDHAGV